MGDNGILRIVGEKLMRIFSSLVDLFIMFEIGGKGGDCWEYMVFSVLV